MSNDIVWDFSSNLPLYSISPLSKPRSPITNLCGIPTKSSHRYTQVEMIWYSETSKAVQRELIMSYWASDETKIANFGDERLNKR